MNRQQEPNNQFQGNQGQGNYYGPNPNHPNNPNPNFNNSGYENNRQNFRPHPNQGPGPVVGGSFDLKKILFVIKGWLTARPFDNFNVSFTGIESLAALAASVICMTIYFNTGLSKLLASLSGVLGQYGDQINAGMTIFALVIYILYILFSYLAVFGVSSAYAYNPKAKGAVMQSVAIGSTILSITSLAATLVGVIFPLLGFMVYSLGFHAFWTALYFGMQKKFIPSKKSPFWGMMLARVLAFLASYSIIHFIIKALVGEATRSFNRSMMNGFPF